MHATARRHGRLIAEETGATSIEYALLAALIGFVIIGAAMSMGSSLSTIFRNTNSQIVTEMSSGS